MANLEDEHRDLREKNSELVQEVQFWKMTAAQREKEKLELMRDLNDLRLKLSRLRSGGAAEARKLDAELQSASEEALTHLVQASGAVARSIELAKQYMRNREELELQAPRWSSLSGATPPNSDSKVNKVPPLLIGGQSIQPVVALRRTLLSSARTRSPNQNTNVTERAVPMHVLQDVYIPLTRIDMADLQINSESDIDNSTDDLGLPETSEQSFEESQNNITEDMNDTRRLDDVLEEAEPEDDDIPLAERNSYGTRLENPLEGPSWLLDRPHTASVPRARSNLEPDSTTPCDHPTDDAEKENEPLSVTLTFTPTVRRKRTSPPPSSPLRSPRRRRPANSNRVLKVVVAKMRLSSEHQGGSPPKIPKLILPRTKDTQRRSTVDSPPVTPKSPSTSPRGPSESNTKRDGNTPRSPKTKAGFDEPSPNGSTDAGLMVLASSRQKKRRHAISSDSDSDGNELDRNISDNDVKASDNNIGVSDNDNNLNDSDSDVIRDTSNISENGGDERNNHKRCNVSERHVVNRLDTSADSETDNDVIEDNKGRETQRGTASVRKVNRDNNVDSENEEFRGFANESRSDNAELNTSDSHDKFKNVTKSRGNNVTSSRGKSATSNRGKKVTKSRDTNVNASRENNVTKRSTSERRETNVSESHGNSRHDTSVAEPNVSGRRNGRSVTKRYASDRQDGNVSENSTSCQSHDVDSDTSNSEVEWGRGRSRRTKKNVTYTEVPLNRKMRR